MATKNTPATTTPATPTTPAVVTPAVKPAPAPVLTQAQKDAVAAAWRVMDALSVVAAGLPDTPAAREARAIRTELERCFPEAFVTPSPIVTAGA